MSDDAMKALDEVHDARSELIMQTAPIRLAIMQSGEVSDRDRALCRAVEDLDAAIKRFVRASAALVPPADDEVEAIRARHERDLAMYDGSASPVPRQITECATLLRALAAERARRVERAESLAELVGAASLVAGALESGINVGPHSLAALRKAIDGVVSAATLTKETP